MIRNREPHANLGKKIPSSRDDKCHVLGEEESQCGRKRQQKDFFFFYNKWDRSHWKFLNKEAEHAYLQKIHSHCYLQNALWDGMK